MADDYHQGGGMRPRAGDDEFVEGDEVLYSTRRRIDGWLAAVLLTVIFVTFAFIVPSDMARVLDYSERVYVVTMVGAGGLLVVGYTWASAEFSIALNSFLFYAIVMAGVTPRHLYLVSLDGTERIAAPYFTLYLCIACLLYFMLCIWQKRFPGDIVVFGTDPVLNYHQAMDLLYAIWATPAFRGASNYVPQYAASGPYGAARGAPAQLGYYGGGGSGGHRSYHHRRASVGGGSGVRSRGHAVADPYDSDE